MATGGQGGRLVVLVGVPAMEEMMMREEGVDSPLLWLEESCMAMARVEGELEDQVIASRHLPSRPNYGQKATRKAHEEGQRLSDRIGQRSG